VPNRSERQILWADAALSGLPAAADSGHGEAAIDKIYNDSVTTVWKLLHKAICNEFYHQNMMEKRATEDRDVRFWGILLLLFGLASAFIPALGGRGARWQTIRNWILFAIALGLGIGGAATLMSDSGTMMVEHRTLKAQWTSLKTELDEVRNSLRAISSGHIPVPPETLARIDLLRRRESALIQSETDAIDQKIYDQSWGDANEILYKKGIRTEEQAKTYFDQQVKDGLVPYRNPIPKSI